MRNDLFEAAVVNQKLQALFLASNCKVNLTDLEEGPCGWFVEGFGRGSIVVMENILRFCKENQDIAEIKSKINLNDSQMTRYLEYLVYQELLNQNNSQYVTTQKGQSLLKLFVKLHDFFGVNHP